MSETRTIHDPYIGKDVQISNRLVDRLRGRYACGPILPNGEPEFGWREMPTVPIQREAADRIESLEAQLAVAKIGLSDQQRLAIACGNGDYADDIVCPTCKGHGHITSPAIAAQEPTQ